MALLFSSAWDDALRWTAALKAELPDLDCRVWPDGVGDPNDIEYALAWRPKRGVLKAFPNLKAIFSLGAGVDHLMDGNDLPDGVPVVRMVDPALTAGMSEYVVYWTLHHYRKFAAYARQAAERNWRPLPQKAPRECRVGIMGVGVMGADAARKLRALDFDVAGWGRTIRNLPGVPGFQGAEGLRDFLARTDILVCLLPLTPDTRAILNAGTFARLPKGAVVINAARGGHLVDGDLLEALESGQLSAAVLDVFHAEPLAADHPFWTHPKIDVTPHVASLTVPESAAKAVAENIRRMRAGEPPQPIVDPVLGY